MRNIKYDCYRELLETEWRYVHTHTKMNIDGHEGDVHEYQCLSCKRGIMYLTDERLEEIILSNKKEKQRR